MKKLVCLLFLSSCVSATSTERLVKHTEDKVVKIGIVTDEGEGNCSGAVISEDGDVLTCAHCFEHHGVLKKIFIKDSKEQVQNGYIFKIDRKKDLAIVCGVAPRKSAYFDFGKSPNIGQQVLSFGSPLGIQHTASVGWVTNIVRHGALYVLHTAFINPGNSGGPLVDLHGRLVGINEATLTINILQEAQGLYVAISLETIKAFLKE